MTSNALPTTAVAAIGSTSSRPYVCLLYDDCTPPDHILAHERSCCSALIYSLHLHLELQSPDSIYSSSSRPPKIESQSSILVLDIQLAQASSPTDSQPRKSYHLDDFAVVHQASKALRVDLALAVLAGQQLVPPPEQEVPGDKLEPRRERVCCGATHQRSGLFAASVVRERGHTHMGPRTSP